MCAILYRVFVEVLTEKTILEQKPERRERKSFRDPDKHISGRENYYKGLVKGMHRILEERKGGRCGWGYGGEWENNKSEK